MSDERKMCRHCRKKPANRPRQTCWRCYYTPGVKELYPPTGPRGVRGVRGVGNGNRSAPAEAPTAELPATRGKLEAMARRARAGTSLHHAGDAGRDLS